MIRQEIKKLIEKSIKELQKEGEFPNFEIPEIKIERPEQKTHGDYATNIAMILAKIVKLSPVKIAEKIKYKIQNTPKESAQLPTGQAKYKILGKVEVAAPGFINFWIDDNELKKLFSRTYYQGIKAFQRKPKKRETIVIEYSSPNIAKPLGIHHLRTTIIGQALVNILRFSGHRVISLSFPGDWGTQFGLLIAAYKRWGDKKKLKENPISEMLNLYVRFSKAAKEDLKLLEEGRREFKKLEEGDPENRKIWQWFTKESLRDFNRVYKILDVRIENTIGESFYEPELKSLIEGALKKGVAERGEDNSAVIIVPDSETPEIIQKSDGATIYTTRELAAIRHRFKKWRATKIIYVAANQQAFHLNQVFGAAERLGFAKRGQLIHVKFGTMLAAGGKKFATREGRLIPLEEVLKEVIERARKVVEKLNPSLSRKEKEKIAKIVGIGAIKFFDLSRNRLSDIVFDWDQMLNLKGFSAPYLQYTYARFASILRRAKFKKGKNFPIIVSHPLPERGEAERRVEMNEVHRLPERGEAERRVEMNGVHRLPERSEGLQMKVNSGGGKLHRLEREIMVKILFFDEVLEEISQNLFPNQLADYLYDLSNSLNNFYETLPVIKSKTAERLFRLHLVYGAKEVLKTGLNLLGISAPERM